MPLQFDPPSGTRDFLAAELETRQRAFAVIERVYSSYGFEPLQTPAFWSTSSLRFLAAVR